MSSQLSASVNVANGNLVLRSKDIAVNAPGLTMRIDQFFNLLSGQSGPGAAGLGGSLSTGQDIGLLINGSGAGSTVTFFGPSGFTATFTATSAIAYTAPAGINATLVKTSSGYTLTYNLSGEKLTFTTGGYLVADVDRNGVGLSLAYDSSNRLASITDGAGRVTTLTWNPDGTLKGITDPAGRTVTYTYASGGVKTITYADGAKVTIDNTATGALDAVQTPNGNWTSFDYDGTGRRLRIDRYTTPGAKTGPRNTTRYAYPNATTTVATDPRGGRTTYTSDSSGRVTRVVDPLGNSRSVTWTANSDLATAVDALGTGTAAGNTVRYSYDTANNLIAVALPTGAAARASYVTGSACGTTTTGSGQGGSTWQPKCSTDAAGNTRSFSYDPAGNLLTVKDTTPTTGTSGSADRGTGATPATYTYQAASGGTSGAGTACGGKVGQVCTATDGIGAKTRYTYDTAGNLTTLTPPSPLGTVTIGYDSLGRATSVVDGLGATTTYSYDAYDRVATTTSNAGNTGGATASTATASYNPDGNLTSLNDSAAGVATWGYDALGREISRKQPTTPGAAGTAPTLTTSYDANGNVASVSDVYGRVVYAYNAANQLTSMVTPKGTSGSATETMSFAYNKNGAETSRTYPNGITTTTTRDNTGRATQVRSAVGSTVIADLRYTWTAPGGSGAAADRALVQTRTDAVGINVPVGAKITYSYDGLGRLIAADERTATGAPSASWGYEYDKAGNRTKVTSPVGGTGAAVTTYTYNTASQVTARNGSATGWSSDGNGNQTSGAWGSATYNGRDALTALTPSGTSTATPFRYSGSGNSTRLTVNAATHVNGPVGLAATATPSGAWYAFRYTPDGRLISAGLPDGTSRYYLSDLQGSVIAVSNANTFTAKYAYDPYGVTRTTSGGEATSNPFRYTAAYTDTNHGGLYRMGARYYDPTTGRFTQPDPSGQENNPYAYALNNPINFVDPTGLVGSTTDQFIASTVLSVGGTASGIALAAAGVAFMPATVFVVGFTAVSIGISAGAAYA